MPMLRRGPDPLELAGVLRRLERLQIVAHPATTGWLPHAPPAAGVDAQPPSEEPLASIDRRPRSTVPRVGGRAWQARLRTFLPARLHVNALDPGRRGVVVLAVVALLGACGGAWYFLHAAPHEHAAVAPTDLSADNGGGASADPTSAGSARYPTASALAGGGLASVGPSVAVGASAPTASAGEVVVDVVGRVAKAGVFTLPVGSRIVDAISAAGGALPGTDLTALDLARKVSDGQEIFVGIPPPSGPAAQSAGGVVGDDSDPASGTGSTGALVDLNTATQAELESLPGVGAVTAQRILAWRTQHGRFTSVTQLQQVSGIGPAKYAALTGLVKV